MRKNKLLITLIISFILLINLASGFSLEYEKEFMVLPETENVFYITVNNSGGENTTINMSCESEIQVDCPERIDILKDETKKVLISAKSENPGVYNISFRIGGENGSFEIISTNTIKSLLNILDNYNKTITAIKNRNPEKPIPQVSEIEEKLKYAYYTYENREYTKTNEYIREIQKELNNISVNISINVGLNETKEKTGRPKGFETYYLAVLFVLVVLIIIIIFVHKSKKTEKVEYKKDLSDIKKSISHKSRRKK